MINPELLPDFLIIGAGKSGTTSLDHYLSQHPEIFMTRMKEPDFFGYETIDATKLFGPEKEHYQRAIKTIDEYQKLYLDAEPHQKKGETSNTNLSSPLAAGRIKHYVPDAKLIAIFRQPTKRLFSRYMHLHLINELPTPEFTDVLDRESVWWHRKDLVPEGFYSRNLAPYYDLFPRENIKVYLTEELHKDPAAIMNDIYEFIGVGPYDEIDFSVISNKSGIVKNRFYDLTLGSNSIIKKAVKAVLPESFFYELTRYPQIKKITQYLNGINLKPASLDPELYQKITTEVYSEDIKALEKLTGKDLKHWL
ncbi:sulfotransferase family protein [Fulvivirga sedimenti]|uniref:Sulfotransferase n=1 Tax=Fulvivirga sedimenti TaxID=2879465 RepID=A0A9X1L1Z6_9BACT|nr:sulfotransferase [Fulvivirga sedimenti]MCA6078767.1 sulfotransferase [Fulvivirga sedimenti]